MAGLKSPRSKLHNQPKSMEQRVASCMNGPWGSVSAAFHVNRLNVSDRGRESSQCFACGIPEPEACMQLLWLPTRAHISSEGMEAHENALVGHVGATRISGARPVRRSVHCTLMTGNLQIGLPPSSSAFSLDSIIRPDKTRSEGFRYCNCARKPEKPAAA